MVDVVTTVAGGGTIAPVGQQAAIPSAAGGTTSVARTTQTALANFSHRLYDDPITGVLVTDQLDSHGHVAAQTPSGFVLAYLRNGLGPDGLPKKSLTA
jgi:hypothetical protein